MDLGMLKVNPQFSLTGRIASVSMLSGNTLTVPFVNALFSKGPTFWLTNTTIWYLLRLKCFNFTFSDLPASSHISVEFSYAPQESAM